ncbi:hypothetical protein NFI96_006783 [Prochilodus magdalenae]|nr:hypothetical protein NFI96_006783 [Prochilodus magdalenae]
MVGWEWRGAVFGERERMGERERERGEAFGKMEGADGEGLHALRRVLGSTPTLTDPEVMDRVKVTTADLRLAMTQVKPSAMREVAIDVPKVRSLSEMNRVTSNE